MVPWIQLAFMIYCCFPVKQNLMSFKIAKLSRHFCSVAKSCLFFVEILEPREGKPGAQLSLLSISLLSSCLSAPPPPHLKWKLREDGNLVHCVHTPVPQPSKLEQCLRHCRHLPRPSSLFHALIFYFLLAKSLQSCPTLCDPIDGSPPGSPVPGILQARTLEWVAISFSNAWKWKVKVVKASQMAFQEAPMNIIFLVQLLLY